MEEINRVKSGTSLGTYSLFFRGSLTPFPEYVVPIEMPVYRLNNGRTIARQKEYIAKHGLAEDFFIKDPDSQAANDAQEEILEKMVNEADLYGYFKDPHTIQLQPMILDNNGYIINGNRRICAMRKLIKLAPSKYSKYDYIRVIFLEKYNEEDIIKLEAQLQIEKDIKAPYSWVTEALLYKGLMEKGYKYDLLEKIYNKKKNELQTYIDMLSDTDEYLESREAKNQYSKIEEAEFVFRPLNSYRKDLRDPQDKEIFKQTIFKLLDDPTIVGGRVYGIVKDIFDDFEQIKSNYLNEHAELKAPTTTTATKVKNKSYSLLEPVQQQQQINEQSVQTNENIISFLKDKQKSKDAGKIVVETVDLCKRAKKEGKSKDAFRKNIQNAQTNLINAKACYNHNSNVTGVLKELENIDSILKDIKGLLK